LFGSRPNCDGGCEPGSQFGKLGGEASIDAKSGSDKTNFGRHISRQTRGELTNRLHEASCEFRQKRSKNSPIPQKRGYVPYQFEEVGRFEGSLLGKGGNGGPKRVRACGGGQVRTVPSCVGDGTERAGGNGGGGRRVRTGRCVASLNSDLCGLTKRGGRRIREVAYGRWRCGMYGSVDDNGGRGRSDAIWVRARSSIVAGQGSWRG